jgi:hypothetical protein
MPAGDPGAQEEPGQYQEDGQAGIAELSQKAPPVFDVEIKL